MDRVGCGMPLKVRPDFKRFIARQERDIKPDTARLEELPEPAGRTRRVEWWAEEVAVVLGAKSFAKQLARVPNDHYFWDKRLLPYAYIVGRTYEDDPILQVVSGKYAGQILLFNHESYYGVFDDLAALVAGGRVRTEFRNRALPILAKRGYKSGRPTPDQIMAVLLDEDLEGAERISASFDAFYSTIHRYCEGRPKPSPPAARKRGRKVAFTEIRFPNPGHWESQMSASDGVAYVAPGGVGLVALRPGRVPVRVANIDWVLKLAAAGTRLYMVSREEEVETGDVLAASSDGGRTFKSIATGYFDDLAAAPDGGVWAVQGGRLVHYPAPGRSRTSKVTRGNCYRIGDRFAFSSAKPGPLGGETRAKSIVMPPRVADIEDLVVTPAGTALAMTLDSGVLRSTDSGASWRKVPRTDDGALKCGARLSTGAIVAGGRDLLISHDDGQTFSVVTGTFGFIERVAELGDELLLATEQYVYCVQLSQLASADAARSSRGVRPIHKAKQAAPLRPLSSYVAVIRERVWQIQPFDKTKAYSASVDRGAVRVSEQGSRIVYSKRVSSELPGRFRVHNDWLVYETFPREVEREKRRAAQEAAEFGTGREIACVIRTP